jgi:hypothetical protein
MAQIKSGASTDLLTVNPGSKAARVELVDQFGNPLAPQNGSALNRDTARGSLVSGADHRINRLLRLSSNGDMMAAQPAPLLYDSCEGGAVDTGKWVQTIAGAGTIAQASAGVTLNAALSASAGMAAMHTSHRTFAYAGRNSLLFRARMRPSTAGHQNNNLIELGFGNPASAALAPSGVGAFWRKDGTGQWVPVISVSPGSEQLGVAVSDATFAAAIAPNSFAVFEVFAESSRVTFRIVTTAGVVVSEQVLDLAGTVAELQATHLNAFYRTYQISATGGAVAPVFAAVAVYNVDNALGLDFRTLQVGQGYGSMTSPTLYTQLANYANNVAPSPIAAASMSNTAAAYTTLGGQFAFGGAAGPPAGGETDYIAFGFQNPSPYNMYVYRNSISTANVGAPVATTPTLLQWSHAFNSSTVSLATGAPYAPNRKTIGMQTALVGTAAGDVYKDPTALWEGVEVVYPGRFYHVFMKLLVGSPTVNQIIRGICSVDAVFQ